MYYNTLGYCLLYAPERGKKITNILDLIGSKDRIKKMLSTSSILLWLKANSIVTRCCGGWKAAWIPASIYISFWFYHQLVIWPLKLDFRVKLFSPYLPKVDNLSNCCSPLLRSGRYCGKSMDLGVRSGLLYLGYNFYYFCVCQQINFPKWNFIRFFQWIVNEIKSM